MLQNELRMSLDAALAEYRDQWQGEATTVDLFRHFLHSHAEVFQRVYAPGHFTASALVLSADSTRTLLTHHRKLGLWLQPGGHADGDADLQASALREAQEETALPQLQAEDGILDLDRHRIPARGSEPEHWHYDVRYVVRSGENQRFVVGAESHALAWRKVTEVAADPQLDESLRRMARKFLARSG